MAKLCALSKVNVRRPIKVSCRQAHKPDGSKTVTSGAYAPPMLRPVLAAIALSVLAGGAGAASIAPRSLDILTPEQIDPSRILPPPPALDSGIQAAEMAELHRIQAERSQARLNQAAWDDQHQDWRLFVQQLGPKFDMAALPATAKVMRAVSHDMGIVSVRAKDYFKRPRPWVTDLSLKGCPISADTDPWSSYHSGHTLYAFSAGVVLAGLMPDRAQTILERAQDFGYSRMVCGVHYRSDVAAGEAIGTIIGHDMLNSPKMQADLAAARAELKAAGF